MRQVSEGTVERAGQNILGLVTNLAGQHLDSELKSEVAINSNLHSNANCGQVVFFDVLGIFMLQYSSLTGILLNSLSVIVVLVVFIVGIRRSLTREKATKADVLKILVIFMLGNFLVGSLLAVAFSALVAYLLALAGCDMSWFVLGWSS